MINESAFFDGYLTYMIGDFHLNPVIVESGNIEAFDAHESWEFGWNTASAEVNDMFTYE